MNELVMNKDPLAIQLRKLKSPALRALLTASGTVSKIGGMDLRQEAKRLALHDIGIGGIGEEKADLRAANKFREHNEKMLLEAELLRKNLHPDFVRTFPFIFWPTFRDVISGWFCTFWAHRSVEFGRTR